MNNFSLTTKEAMKHRKEFNRLMNNISRKDTPWYKDCIINPNTDTEIKENPNKYTYFQIIIYNNKEYKVEIYIYRTIFGSFYIHVYFPLDHKDAPRKVNNFNELKYLNEMNKTYKTHGHISHYYKNSENVNKMSIGFVCDNPCDLVPFVWNDEKKCIVERKYFDPNQIMNKYRDFKFAKQQATNLAKQIIMRYK